MNKTWYLNDTADLSIRANQWITAAQNSRANGSTYDQVKQSKLPYANAYWWLYEYKQGQGYQEIIDLVGKYYTHPAVQSNKDDLEHQRLARIAGFWVPGRRPGIPNSKPYTKKDKTDAVPAQEDSAQNPSVFTGNSVVRNPPSPVQAVHPSPGPLLNQAMATVEASDFARLIDVSSLSTPKVWAVVVAILQAASRDSRTDQDQEVLNDSIQVLLPLTKSE